MNKSKLLNRKSLILQHHERKESKNISIAIRKILKITVEFSFQVAELSASIDILTRAIDVIFPKVRFSIKYMCKYIGNPFQEQLLLQEGKPYLNK